MAAAAAGLIYLYSGKGITSQRPVQCESAPSFMDADEFTIREHFFRLMPTYDLITCDNCDSGDMKREWLTFTRKTRLNADGADLGEIDTKILSLGYDMTVYDEQGQIISTIDHKILDSALNFGGYYIEIKDPAGNLQGILKQDPFALWTQSNWKYFEVISPSGELVAEIEYKSILPDTYHVSNKSGIDNRTLAGLVSILDQIQDEATSSGSSRSSDD